MKKVLTLLIALIALPILAAAQNSDGFIPIPSDKVQLEEYEDIFSQGHWTPPSVTYNNETLITFRQYNGDNEMTITLYDKKLDKVLEYTQTGELFSISTNYDGSKEENYALFPYVYLFKEEYDIDSNFYASQTLFNDDNRFEFVKYTFGNDWIAINDNLRIRELTGCQIINDNNEVVSEIKFDDPINLYTSSLGENVYIYEIDDYRYMTVYGHYYLIDKKTSSLKSVKMPEGLRALPSIARRHEDITVDFEASSSTRVLHLVDANGRTVLSDKIPAGTTNHKISSGTLSSGLYIVTLSDGTSTTETTKIIIR